jgi:hypothetical protein
MNGYSNEKMVVNDVCEWLKNTNNNIQIKTQSSMALALSIALDMYYKTNNEEMERRDILKDIFIKNLDNGAAIFRSMECDVTTYVELIRYDEAHVN